MDMYNIAEIENNLLFALGKRFRTRSVVLTGNVAFFPVGDELRGFATASREV
jgi:hypothetical protein